MLTPFGKELRKLRIDRSMLMKHMAEGLNVSPSFISAIEAGRKAIPSGFIERVASFLDLSKDETESLRQKARISANEFRFTLPKNASIEDREAAALLARTFEDGDSELISRVSDLIKRRRS